ncbi:MAG: DNA translocase FtsK, partial [Anaerolineales bacterium]
MSSSTRRTQGSSSQKKPEQPKSEEKSSSPSWLDRLGGWWMHFNRFAQDIIGVSLLAIAFLTLLGLLGLTTGALIRLWVWFLRRWLGLGSYLVSLGLAVTGLFVLRQHFSRLSRPRLSRILALELAGFALITFLAIRSGLSLTEASQGEHGGLVGWGLAALLDMVLPPPWSTLLTIFVLIFLVFYGLGFGEWSVRLFEQWLLRGDQPVSGMTEEKQRDTGTSRQYIVPPSNLTEVPHSEAIDSGAVSKRDERLPPLNLLLQDQNNNPDEESIQATADLIEKTLLELGVPTRVIGFRVGPVVTQFAVEPGYTEKPGLDGKLVRQKVRVSQIAALQRDLARALAAERLRIEAPVPGHSFVGIEVPNRKNTVVRLRPLLESESFQRLGSPLALALGRDVSGLPVVADLARMPHLLIAGTTGSGKSVCIAALTICLVMNNSPEELRLAMLDPKMVELARFNGLPHLLGQVESEPERMLAVLRWALAEMDNRYRILEAARARDLDGYNRKAERRKQPVLPRIVIFIDELADLMMTAPDQTEHSLIRLAQMARATGIHLVLATQRPSTDVVTGLIKANFPARISFNVATSVDSRVILDSNGAEDLLGRGDMLFLNPEVGTPLRSQGVLVTDHEIERVVGFWQRTSPAQDIPAPWEEYLQDEEEGSDELLQQAIALVRQTQRASASFLQRRLRIGYPRAARLIDELEALGVVGPAQGGGREREVLW